MGIDVRVDQKFTTGTKGIGMSPVDPDGLLEGVAVGSSNGVAVGAVAGGVGSALGRLVDDVLGSRPRWEAVEAGALGRTETPGADVGGVEEPHAAAKRATSAKMTSRVLTDRLIAVDLRGEGK
jgi:hypothetical protein